MSGPTAEIVRTEVMSPGPAYGFAGLLDVPPPDPAVSGLPLLWHWLYLLDRPAQADLGPDGHPVRGVIPAAPGPDRRRMWAGGEVTMRCPLRFGLPATRQTRLRSVERKAGRSGPLDFALVDQVVSQDGQVVLEEVQRIVYREPVDVAAPPAPRLRRSEPASGDGWVVEVSPTLLFRFSALTYNAHRIHYDHRFAREVEGYAGLVVQGPLQAMIMAEAARARGADTTGPSRMDYRLETPLIETDGLVAQVSKTGEEGYDISITDFDGRRTAVGHLRPLTGNPPTGPSPERY